MVGIQKKDGISGLDFNFNFFKGLKLKTSKFVLSLKGGATIIRRNSGRMVDCSKGGSLTIKPTMGKYLGDFNLCKEHGFFMSFDIYVTKYVENAVYFSTGGDDDSSYGAALIANFGSLYLIIRTETQEWYVNLQKTLINVQMKFEFSFDVKDGVKVYGNNVVIGSSSKAMTRVVGTTTIRCSTTVVFGRGVSINRPAGPCQIGTINVYDTADRAALVRQEFVEKCKSAFFIVHDKYLYFSNFFSMFISS